MRSAQTWRAPDRSPCDCGCAANTFSSKQAEDDLRRYLEEGPDGTTRALIDAIVAEGVEGAVLLDIGGGIGEIQVELLAAGAARARAIDASEAYVETARELAARRGLAARTSVRLGDFVALAPEVEPVDVVTLDRVVCCYPDVDALLGAATDKARRLVGLVYPRDTWWNGIARVAIAAWGRLRRDPTRWYLFPTECVDGIMRRAGFTGRLVTRHLARRAVPADGGGLTRQCVGSRADRARILARRRGGRASAGGDRAGVRGRGQGMTDTIREPLRTRRSLLTAAAGGAAALAVGAIKPAEVAGATQALFTEVETFSTATTTLTNTTDGSTAVAANAQAEGAGVVGTSEAGHGVRGVSADTSDPENNPANAGVVGVAGSVDSVADHIGLTGVYGYSDPSPDLDFVAAGVWGDSGDWGVIGSGSGGVLGDGSIGVFGTSAEPLGVGVYATAEDADGYALVVDGRAAFQRSGVATVAKDKKKEVVSLAGCNPNTMVIAVLAQDREGRYVRAVVAENGKFTICLNAKVSKKTRVNWIALTNPNTMSG